EDIGIPVHQQHDVDDVLIELPVSQLRFLQLLHTPAHLRLEIVRVKGKPFRQRIHLGLELDLTLAGPVVFETLEDDYDDKKGKEKAVAEEYLQVIRGRLRQEHDGPCVYDVEPHPHYGRLERIKGQDDRNRHQHHDHADIVERIISPHVNAHE